MKSIFHGCITESDVQANEMKTTLFLFFTHEPILPWVVQSYAGWA